MEKKDVSKKIRASLKKSFCGERRFSVQLPDVTDHKGHAMGKVRTLHSLFVGTIQDKAL